MTSQLTDNSQATGAYTLDIWQTYSRIKENYSEKILNSCCINMLMFVILTLNTA